jgi:2-succinyl-5-enolpyruvyl-6-hydroxy-3-cyclohexene-1-carboxylate synthase
MSTVSDANLNALWCRCIAEELLRAGMRRCVLCPGSRNSPLIFALVAAGLDCLSHVDERSAGFLALGLARADGSAVGICVTSGSAVANLLPAVSEAHAQGVRLVVLAADRPWELVGVGAPQAMSQRGLLGSQLFAELDLGEPMADDAVLRLLRSRLSRLVQCARGPLHINVPMREPLAPLPDARFHPPEISPEARDGRGADVPYVRVADSGRPGSEVGSAPPLASLPWLVGGLRGLVVVGAGDGLAELAVGLATACGYPLLADAPSSLRHRPVPLAITCADALVQGALGSSSPELIIQVGAMPLARSMADYLGRQRCPWLCLDDGRSNDYLARAWAAVPAASEEACAALAQACATGDALWRDQWLAAEARASATLAARMRDEPWGEVLAAHLACRHPGFSFLHLASSMAVRHGNLHIQEAAGAVYANRGLNGIDGTLGTFLGELVVHDGGGLLLIGDLAFLHDLPALALLSSPGRGRGITRASAIVVLNNGGGGIFDFLAVAQVPGAGHWVRTPQGLDLAAASAQFGLPFARVAGREQLAAALATAAATPALSVIECVVPGGCVERHRLLVRELAAAADAAVAQLGVNAPGTPR